MASSLLSPSLVYFTKTVIGIELILQALNSFLTIPPPTTKSDELRFLTFKYSFSLSIYVNKIRYVQFLGYF